eukprot:scaffold921_cov37-Tisochrysis_lutea.AAC.1
MSSPLERPKYCSLDLFRPSALTPGSHGVDHIKELSKAPLKHHTPSLSDLALTTHIHEFVGCCLELIEAKHLRPSEVLRAGAAPLRQLTCLPDRLAGGCRGMGGRLHTVVAKL